jgi:agmatine/peptidylarginine deiminase
VFVPQYSCEQDLQALEIFKTALPTYSIWGIPAQNIIQENGSLHCLSANFYATSSTKENWEQFFNEWRV